MPQRTVRVTAPMRVHKSTHWWCWDCMICKKNGIAVQWHTAFNVGFAHIIFSHSDWRLK